MAELTPEEKQAMIEAASAEAQARSENETRLLREAEMMRQSEGMGKVMPAKPTHDPTLVSSVANAEWGPYDDYVLVTTPYGQFGIPKGEILWFEETQTFSRRAGTMVTIHEPRYRSAKTGLTRDARTGRYYDPATESPSGDLIRSLG